MEETRWEGQNYSEVVAPQEEEEEEEVSSQNIPLKLTEADESLPTSQDHSNGTGTDTAIFLIWGGGLVSRLVLFLHRCSLLEIISE